MKKTLMISAIFVLVLVAVLSSSVSASNLQVEKTSSDEVLVVGTGEPAIFDLKITNSGSPDTLSFYNLVGFQFDPQDNVDISAGETKNIQLKVTPIGNLTQRGYYTFPYYIRSKDGTDTAGSLTFKIVDLKDAFQVGASDIDPESQVASLFIKNRENFDFGKIDVDFTSPFFTKSESFDMGPNEIKNFSIDLQNSNFAGLTAGFYTINAEVTVNGHTGTSEGVIKFVEKNIVTTTSKDLGLFINTQTIEKKNAGNTIEDSETVIKKNIISRLFTTFNPEPDSVNREGFRVYYTWTEEITPGETFTITVKTNWLFPLLIILLLVAVVVLAKQYSGTNLLVRKRVAFVRAKGGEFASKVSVIVTAKKSVERVNVVDRLPPLVKIYERFGSEQPTRVDEKNRRIEWNFEYLNPGEVRILSYVIYSKVGVMGKFALPSATAIFERNGNIHEEESNQAFFVAEQRTKDIEEE